jgi:hypothetical protein
MIENRSCTQCFICSMLYNIVLGENLLTVTSMLYSIVLGEKLLTVTLL